MNKIKKPTDKDEVNEVEVHFFKQSGKWYTTEKIKWSQSENKNDFLIDDFSRILIRHLRDDKTNQIRLLETTAVCLTPNHKNAHPQMITVEEALFRTSESCEEGFQSYREAKKALKEIGEDSVKAGTDKLTDEEIQNEIDESRNQFDISRKCEELLQRLRLETKECGPHYSSFGYIEISLYLDDKLLTSTTFKP